jgi:type IV pilus assembly protein PilO
MRRSFDEIRASLTQRGARRDPRMIARAVLGTLLLANIVAALLLFRPWGGSREELEERLAGLRTQVQQRQTVLTRLRSLASKVETARQAGDRFMGEYFVNQQTAYSTLLEELGKAAKEAGIQEREHTFSLEAVEGSDTLGMLTITANYQGSYADLVHFVNRLDRSRRFLILESLTATPQQNSGVLNVNMKLNTFVREPR